MAGACTTSPPTACQMGRNEKTKPKDECCDSKVTAPPRYNLRNRNNSNAITTGQGKLDSSTVIIEGASVEGISKECSRLTRSTARLKVCMTKTSTEDECCNSEVIIHRRYNLRCRTTAQEKLDSSTVTRAHPQGRKRKPNPKDERCSSEVTIPRRINHRGRSRRRRSNRNTIPSERGKLNCMTFFRYLMHIWGTFPEEKVKSVLYFDPLWFHLYDNKYYTPRVLNWIKAKPIFSAKYIFVPIVKWSHWSLLIICHLGEPLNSETETPCMLLLDSLHALGPTRHEPLIRRLLFDMYKSEERMVSEEELKKIPLLIPEVPQQTNGEECGFYVLYYIKLFLESAPKTFNISEGYPYFLKQDWFTVEGVDSFYKYLDDIPDEDHDHDDDDGDDADDGSIVLIRIGNSQVGTML